MEEVKKEKVSIIVVEDDVGHASLIIRNLKRAGFKNNFIQFRDGQQILDFLFKRGSGPHYASGAAYLLLLDIRMPKVDGVEVLRQIKEEPELRKIPVIMVTTTDDPREVEKCHSVGCSVYITKPIDYDKFVDAVRKLGLFLAVIRVPRINGGEEV